MRAGVALLLALAAVSTSAQPVPPCGIEPAELRDERSYRDLRFNRTDDCLAWLAALPQVEGVLATAWIDKAVAALVRFGPAGAPALARFLLSDSARQVPGPLLVQAVRVCVEGLPAADSQRLFERMRSDPAMAAVVREALGG